MVLGFGSRSKKKKGDDGPVMRPSPSLPEMSSQGIPWPQDLVDVSAIRQSPPSGQPARGAAKTSFSSPDRSAISFHKPFRVSPGKSSSGDTEGAGPIASLYMSHPPSAYSGQPQPKTRSHDTRSRHSQRRSRVAPTFNLMVAGAQGTGKSSLLRLIVDTADISPTATADQRKSMDKFLQECTKRTERINSACVEICESRFDRVLLSVIDTPGLDFQEGHELKLERQVSVIMKYLDLQYADTMDEESKVIRKSKGDQHIHLCIYLIDPDTVVTASSRRTNVALPSRSQSEAMLSRNGNRESVDTRVSEVSPTEDVHPEWLTVSPADIRVIKRLSNRVNVLPIIARADILTDEKLEAVKQAIRRDLRNAKLGFGVFGPAKVDDVAIDSRPSTAANGHNSQSDEGFGSEEESEEEERPSRPVIKLDPRRRLSNAARSSSRSRVEFAEMNDAREPLPPDAADPDSLASVRFSAHYFAKSRPLIELLPFAVVMPEQNAWTRRPLKGPPATPSQMSHGAGNGSARPTSMCSTEAESVLTTHGQDIVVENGRGTPTPTPTLRSPSSEHLPFWQSPPRDLKGVFVRKFRWGMVDVLDPTHCDFAALRTAVLSTHMKVLKTNTKEVLYEKYRTEKLLARRATRNISAEDRRRLLEDLGL